jgi:DNA-damage-inducible protein J
MKTGDKDAMSTITIRRDANVKEQFRTFCKASGTTASTAINMFVRACIKQKRIPIDVVSSTSFAMVATEKPQRLPRAR